MKSHKEFTFGWMIFVFVIPIHVLVTYLYLNDVGNKPLGANGYLLVTLIFIITYLLFYGLTTKVTSDTLTVSFGIGLIRKRIRLERVKTVQTIKSPWYYGWGIRIIPKGILYNISGTDGVELRFKDSNRIVRIGTKDSLRLKNEIERRLV